MFSGLAALFWQSNDWKIKEKRISHFKDAELVSRKTHQKSIQSLKYDCRLEIRMGTINTYIDI